MAKILLGWELGANRGHVQHLVKLGAALEERGDTIVYAIQQVDALVGIVAKSAMVMQAPLWPRLLKTVTQPPAPTTATMGDILVRIGLTQAGTLAAMIGGWDAILSLVKPDLVVGDFAPALGCAVRGTVPMIGIGTSFCHPPSSMPCFPNFFGNLISQNQDEILDGVNHELAIANRPALGTLPQLFAFDRVIAIGFSELDAYAPWRADPVFAPAIDIDAAMELRGPDIRNEIFVYHYQAIGQAIVLWDALEQTGLPVRVHIPRLDHQDTIALQKRGFIVEQVPVAWADIAARSRIVLSHGGSGFVSTALAVGIPQVIAYYDVEKLLNARAVGELGLGIHIYSPQINPQSFAADIISLYHDEDFADRAQQASHHFREKLANSVSAGALAAANELLGRR